MAQEQRQDDDDQQEAHGSLLQIGRGGRVPASAGVEDQIDDLAHDTAAAFATPRRGARAEHLGVGVGGRDGEPAAAERGHVHDVVADEADSSRAQPAAAGRSPRRALPSRRRSGGSRRSRAPCARASTACGAGGRTRRRSASPPDWPIRTASPSRAWYARASLPSANTMIRPSVSTPSASMRTSRTLRARSRTFRGSESCESAPRTAACARDRGSGGRRRGAGRRPRRRAT